MNDGPNILEYDTRAMLIILRLSRIMALTKMVYISTYSSWGYFRIGGSTTTMAILTLKAAPFFISSFTATATCRRGSLLKCFLCALSWGSSDQMSMRGDDDFPLSNSSTRLSLLYIEKTALNASMLNFIIKKTLCFPKVKTAV